MTTKSSNNESSSSKTIFVVALLIAVFAAAVIDVVIPITIVDIAKTFKVLPGTVAQLDSLIAISSVVTALLLAAFGAQLRYKLLVMIGTLLIAFCALGLFLAPNFLATQLAVILNGIGSVLIIVTAQTFIGNSYPIDKRAKAIGWVAAAGTLANAVGSPIIGFMTGIGGWRSVLVWFMLPVSLFSFVFVFLAFPRNKLQPALNIKKEPLLTGVKVVLASKSAVACLITAFLGNAFALGGAVLEVTFLRQVFLVPPGLASLMGPLIGLSLITGGAVIGGHIVNHVGRKRLTVIALFSAGLLTLLSFFMRDLIIFLALRWTAAPLIGVLAAAATNLTLEQVPKFRGATMALSSAFVGVGTAVGITVAGAVLNGYVNPVIGFEALGLTVGAFAFAGVLINLLFARDPLEPHAFN
jgi:MFS transporter, DHA1 family, inner membrane transport protein